MYLLWIEIAINMQREKETHQEILIASPLRTTIWKIMSLPQTLPHLNMTFLSSLILHCVSSNVSGDLVTLYSYIIGRQLAAFSFGRMQSFVLCFLSFLRKDIHCNTCPFYICPHLHMDNRSLWENV